MNCRPRAANRQPAVLPLIATKPWPLTKPLLLGERCSLTRYVVFDYHLIPLISSDSLPVSRCISLVWIFF